MLGPKLIVNCKKRIQKFMAFILSILRFKCVGFQNVFAGILIKKCLQVRLYGIDCFTLDYNSVRLGS